MPDDPLILLAKLEVDALARVVELETLRRLRLQARVAGRTDQVTYWVASDDEVEDEETLAALTRFAPSAWWAE